MIHCPECNGDTRVLETRDAPAYVRRRRVCRNSRCGSKVTTVEVVLRGTTHSTRTDVVMVRRGDLDRLFEIASRLAATPVLEKELDRCPE